MRSKYFLFFNSYSVVIDLICSILRFFTHRLFLTGSISLVLFFKTLSLEAQQTVWTNPGVGDWDTASNWSLGVPDLATDAIIDNGGTSVLSQPAGGEASIAYVGYSTNLPNTLRITSSLLAFEGFLGFNPHSSGFIEADGSTTTLQFLFDTTIGNFGTGILLIHNGAIAALETTSLGAQAGGIGSLIVSGVNTECDTCCLSLGQIGRGILLVSDQGQLLTSTFVNMGEQSGGQGDALVDNASWSCQNMTVGLAGNGSLTIQNGGVVNSQDGILAGNLGSNGHVGVRGAGSQWMNSSSLSIGTGGNASLEIDSGALVSAPIVSMNNSILQLNGISGSRGILNTEVISNNGSSSVINFNGGILQAANHNSDFLSGFSTGQVNCATGGAFIDTQNFNIGISSPIAGNGMLTKLGNGVLVLGGANTYSGGTTISAGTVEGNATSIPAGPIVNEGVLIFNQNIPGIFNGSISGSGVFLKEGNAQLQMNVDGSNFHGSSTILSGLLNLNGSVGGILQINNGATLSGNAVLDQVTNNGKISPGNSIGVLTMNQFVNNSTGILESEINGNGTADLIDVAGTAVLNGGQLQVIANPGIYLKGTTYTLIRAAAGLTGQFASTILPVNLHLALSYLPNALILSVLENSFEITGLRGNPLRVAEYIRDHATFNEDFLRVIGGLNALDPSQLSKALDQLHPALFEALAITASDTAHMIHSTFINRLEYLRNACPKNCCNPCAMKCEGLWTAGTADFIRQGRSEGLRRFTTSSEGFSFGYDNKICHSVLLGVGGGYSHTNLHWGHSAGQAKINGYYMGAYATQYNDIYFLDASLLGFVDHHRVRRHIHFADIDRRAKNSHYSYAFSPHIGGGLFLTTCNIDVTPFFAIDYYWVQENHFREHGADSINLHVKRHLSHLLRVEGGVNFSKCYSIFGGILQPNLSISWVGHRFLEGKKYTSSFKSIHANFSVFGTDRCFNQLEIGTGLQYTVDEHFVVNAWYDAELGRKRQEQQFNLEINYQF